MESLRHHVSIYGGFLMKRKAQLKSLYRLTLMYQKAMERRVLPPVLRQAVKLVSAEIHPKILKISRFGASCDIRKIIFNPKMEDTGFKGVYFGSGRLEAAFPDDQTDWKLLGWDGNTRFMMFPSTSPPLWVALHELGHYVDDTFFRMYVTELLDLGCSLVKVRLFTEYRADMRVEFEKAQREAKSFLTPEQMKEPKWHLHVPEELFYDSAPSAYGLLTFSEWIAESFRRYYMEPRFLEARCPSTLAFFDYALQGRVFHRTTEPDDPYERRALCFATATAEERTYGSTAFKKDTSYTYDQSRARS